VFKGCVLPVHEDVIALMDAVSKTMTEFRHSNLLQYRKTSSILTEFLDDLFQWFSTENRVSMD
jgi:hypothetical protein